MIGVERIDRHRDGAADKQAGIDRHPGRAAVAAAKGTTPGARIVRRAGLHEADYADQKDADTKQHGSQKKAGFKMLRGAG
jgi:hypothetical protein